MWMMMRLTALAAALGLLAQAVLPAAHSWRVDSEETAYHARVHDVAGMASVCGDHNRGHRHHSDANCALCPLFVSARLAAAHNAAVGAPDFETPTAALAPLRAVFTVTAALCARAPPAVLS